jgi:hypothetical protein
MRSRTWLCDVARGQHVADGGHEAFRRSLAGLPRGLFPRAYSVAPVRFSVPGHLAIPLSAKAKKDRVDEDFLFVDS